MNLLHKITLLISAIIILANNANAQDINGTSSYITTNERITILERDCTYDNINEIIEIRLIGKDWLHPISWELTIVSNKKIIFSYYSDDKMIDEFFGVNGIYDDNCDNYLECKKEYYLNIGKFLFVNKTLTSDLIFDKNYGGSVYQVAREEIVNKFNLPEKDIENIIIWMVLKLREGNTEILAVPSSPIKLENPKIFVPQVNSFVSFYAE